VADERVKTTCYSYADALVVSEEPGVFIFKGHRHIPEDLNSHLCSCLFFSAHFLFLKDLFYYQNYIKIRIYVKPGSHCV